MKIGLISPFWLPRHGGGQQYVHRLARALASEGIEVFAFCGTKEEPQKDNGNFPVTRWTPKGNIQRSSWQSFFSSSQTEHNRTHFSLYGFMNAAANWARELSLDIVLTNTPIQEVSIFHARELYKALQAMNIKVGVIQHDIGALVQRSLVRVYKENRDWKRTSEVLLKSLASSLKREEPLAAYARMASPLFFEPDFVVSCSNWSSAFVDPTNSAIKTVLHPLVDFEHWSKPPETVEGLDHRHILMSNPQGRKGPEHMADLVTDSDPSWTFRILNSGWGNNAFRNFIPLIKNSLALSENRIDFRDYVMDMREAYQKAGLVFFPSQFEGYGMTAVEPMFSGTPTVSSNYPAVLEAVGDAAYSLCPFTSSREHWKSAVTEVLANREYWSGKSLVRARELADRQERELKSLIRFFGELI